MKNKKFIINVTIAVLLLCSCIFLGCGGGNGNGGNEPGTARKGDDVTYKEWPENLDEKTEKQIKQDFLLHFYNNELSHLTVDSISFEYYFGIFNGYVILAKVGDAAMLTTKTVAGLEFTFDTGGVSIFAWKKNANSSSGRLYDIQEAFDKNYLSEEDIRIMYKRHSAGETLRRN